MVDSRDTLGEVEALSRPRREYASTRVREQRRGISARLAGERESAYRSRGEWHKAPLATLHWARARLLQRQREGRGVRGRQSRRRALRRKGKESRSTERGIKRSARVYRSPGRCRDAATVTPFARAVSRSGSRPVVALFFRSLLPCPRSLSNPSILLLVGDAFVCGAGVSCSKRFIMRIMRGSRSRGAPWNSG